MSSLTSLFNCTTTIKGLWIFGLLLLSKIAHCYIGGKKGIKFKKKSFSRRHLSNTNINGRAQEAGTSSLSLDAQNRPFLITQCHQLLITNLTQNLRRLMVEEILSQGAMWRRKRTTETDNFTWVKMERKGGKLDELEIESEPWQLWQGPRCSCVRTRAELHEKKLLNMLE